MTDEPARWPASPDPQPLASNDETAIDPDAEPPASTRRSRALGVVALALAVLLLVANVAGFVFANDPNGFATALLLAQVTVVGTAITFLLGVVAVISGRGRGWGGAAMGVSVLANPVVLLLVLDLLSGA